MFNFFRKNSNREPPPPQGSLTLTDLNPRVTLHYGIPCAASILAFDPVQSLLAVGTWDGRIKVIGDYNVEGLLVSPKQLPFKNLEFLQNQGFLVSVSKENEIQVWELEHRQMTSKLKWESNITAFSIIYGTSYMYLGDEYGSVSVLKYDAEEGNLLQLPYYVPTNIIAETAGIPLSYHNSVVGVLAQPYSLGERLLIAYENGLVILWDVSEDRVVLVRGNKDLQLVSKTVVNSSKSARQEPSESESDHGQAEKEISSICWASTNGSVLAVGYVDGDIMFWNIPTAAPSKDQKTESSSNNVVKLQLSSARKRLPIIVLHWSVDRSKNDCGGRLYVYGGDEIGTEEVLTMLYLDWSSGIESLKCIDRVDITLNGSFADMVLLPIVGLVEGFGSLLFVLTKPGQLHVYDDACLSSLISPQEKKTSTSPLQYPEVIPTIEPYMTTGKLGLVHRDGKFSRDFSKIVFAVKARASHVVVTPMTRRTKWPLTGGVLCQFHGAEDYLVEKLYVAGYQDGSVRIWDATYASMSLIYVLGSELLGTKIDSANAPVSALDFCTNSLNLAVGYANARVLLYKLVGSANETSLNFVTETGKEVYSLPKGDGPQCTAVFSFIGSPVCNLQFSNTGDILAVGFECGQVAVLDISSSSVLFLTDSVSDSSSPVISLGVKSFPNTNNSINSIKDSNLDTLENPTRNVVFFMTKDGHIVVCDSTTGKILASQSLHLKESSAISMYILEDDGSLISELSSAKHSVSSPQDSEPKNEPTQVNAKHGSIPLVAELETSTETTYSGQRLMELFILLCCENALWLYSLNSVIQGDSNSIRKVHLLKPCCWTATFKKDEKYGLFIVYQTGEIEIRSLPSLQVVVETSLMSILRWNFKTNMEETMCSCNGQIVLINGYEFAFISLLASENDVRIPESLPCLHDKVLAASANPANISPSQKKVEGTVPAFFSGLVKGFKGLKEHNVDLPGPEVGIHNCDHLDTIFSYPPFLKPSKDDQNVVELNLDDIKIDEPLVVSSSSQKSKNDEKDKRMKKEKLFEGANTETKPKPRTVEEIKAKYRKPGDAFSAAAEARNKLAERQEKLEKLRDNTEELQDGAQNFADMASELAKAMEKRKWWKL